MVADLFGARGTLSFLIAAKDIAVGICICRDDGRAEVSRCTSRLLESRPDGTW